MKKIILHIGFGKTGTSSIQKALLSQSEILNSRGVLYPKTGLGNSNHHYKLANMTDIITNSDRELYNDLITEIESSSCDKIIISSEHFSFVKPNFVVFIKDCLKDYDVNILFYVRPQLKLIESTYLQFIKENLDYAFSIKEFFNIHKYSFDFMRRIAPWIKSFGEDKITAILFDKNIIGNDACLNFFDINNISYLRKKYKPTSANPSLIAEFHDFILFFDQGKSLTKLELEIERLIANFIHIEKNENELSNDLNFYDLKTIILLDLDIKDKRKVLINKLLGYSLVLKKSSNLKLINKELEEEINLLYSDSNLLFSNKFLNEEEKNILNK